MLTDEDYRRLSSAPELEEMVAAACGHAAGPDRVMLGRRATWAEEVRRIREEIAQLREAELT